MENELNIPTTNWVPLTMEVEFVVKKITNLQLDIGFYEQKVRELKIEIEVWNAKLQELNKKNDK